MIFGGAYKVKSITGVNYFLTIVDDYSRVVWVYLLNEKHIYSLIERLKLWQ